MAHATQTQTLADFLLARIAEDLAVALAPGSHHWSSGTHYPDAPSPLWDERGPFGEASFPQYADHIIHFDPARAIREANAKRLIVDEHQPWTASASECRVCDEPDSHGTNYDEYCTPARYPCRTLKAVAVVYADHPDYREEWQ